MMYKYLCIEYADPDNLIDSIPIRFRLRDNSVVPKWTDKVIKAQRQYTIDDPGRFYGFEDKQTQITQALARINSCIDIINSHRPIVERRLDTVNDTDTLNYLHHIFEIYHGSLDSQTTEFWKNAPQDAQQALAQLNINVHRIETLQRKNTPRFVVTYFQLPKTQFLKEEDYNYLTDYYFFGGLYLNYVEIGKTLDDLMRDNDQYILPESFKPWQHFSADFRVSLSNTDIIENRINKQNCLKYYDDHKEFFESRGYSKYDPRLRPGYINIGKMIYVDKDKTFGQIKQHQYVQSVDFA